MAIVVILKFVQRKETNIVSLSFLHLFLLVYSSPTIMHKVRSVMKLFVSTLYIMKDLYTSLYLFSIVSRGGRKAEIRSFRTFGRGA